MAWGRRRSPFWMETGSRIGHYLVLSRLGAGGMGEVYLARDERLDRLTAIKVMAAGPRADADAVRRFTQEAKAAAALSHPNIAHIYDAGEVDGVSFLAMEYVEGRTLNLITESLPLGNDELFSLALQVTDALDEAHRKGIVHRDIKPSNLIRNSRGQTKILDFGLAKLSAAAKTKFASTVSGAAPTESGSSSGIAVGSLPYMSPEQALGRDVDPRTDIFSLGAVLYEMAAGRRAFQGSTPAAIFDAILNRAPQSPRMLNPNLPQSFDRIVRRCLEKDPGMRYQTARDLLADLKIAQREVAQPVASPAHVKPSARTWAIVALAGLTVAGAAILGWYVAKQRPGQSAAMRTVPLTSFPGSEREPSFSPDGNQVAFSWNQGKEDDLDIHVKVVEAGMPLRLTSTPASEFSPSWSPDGKFIAFLRQTTDSAGFYLIPALGGLERKLGDASPNRVGADSPFIAWSPDGKQLALVDRETPQSPLSIFLLDLDTNQRRRITSPPANTLGDSVAVFSPDGAAVAFVRTGSLAIQDIWIVSLKDGKERQLTTDKRRIYGLAWSPHDGKLIFSSARHSSSRLWRISPSRGGPEALPGVGDQAGFLALSRNGNRLAFTRTVLDTNVWRYRMPDKLGQPAEGASLMASTRHEQGPRYSPDGIRIVFTSNRSGALEIWVADRDGVNLNQLTTFNGPVTGSPMWSPDGKYIAFDSRPGGNPDVYVVSADGGLPRRFTSDASEEIVPNWSRDGRWIYFASNRTGRFEVFKQSVQGGMPRQITREGGFHGAESPDGKHFYYAKATNIGGLWRVPVEGGKEEQVLPGLRPGYFAYWAFAKGDGIYWVDRQDVADGGARYPLRLFHPAAAKDSVITYMAKRPFNSGLSISPDGQWFLYTQVDQSETDIMMVDSFW